MLVLSRRKGESIIIQDKIEITVLEVDGEIVKIGISAPKEIEILRKELVASIIETNQEAADGTLHLSNVRSEIKKVKKNIQKL